MYDQVDILIEGCHVFKDLVAILGTKNENEIKTKLAKIKDCEIRGDAVEKGIIDELHKTFITPIDREDIHSMAVNIDRSLDILNSISQKLEITEFAHIKRHAVDMVYLKFLGDTVKNIEGPVDIYGHGVDVLPVYGSNKCFMELINNPFFNSVTPDFAVLDLCELRLYLILVFSTKDGHKVFEYMASLNKDINLIVHVREELCLPGQQQIEQFKFHGISCNVCAMAQEYTCTTVGMSR